MSSGARVAEHWLAACQGSCQEGGQASERYASRRAGDSRGLFGQSSITRFLHPQVLLPEKLNATAVLASRQLLTYQKRVSGFLQCTETGQGSPSAAFDKQNPLVAWKRSVISIDVLYSNSAKLRLRLTDACRQMVYAKCHTKFNISVRKNNSYAPFVF